LCFCLVNVDAHAISEVSATCMEAINYFCEIQLSKQMMRRGKGGAKQLDWQEYFPDGNAILSLPTQGGYV